MSYRRASPNTAGRQRSRTPGASPSNTTPRPNSLSRRSRSSQQERRSRPIYFEPPVNLNFKMMNEPIPEVSLVILGFCDSATVGKVMVVNREWKDYLARSEKLWRLQFQREFRKKYAKMLVDLNGSTNKEQSVSVSEIAPLGDCDWLIQFRQNMNEVLARRKKIKALKRESEFNKNWFYAVSAARILNGNSFSNLLFLPLFLFSVTLPLKLDNPNSMSWFAAFSPLLALDALLLIALGSYWGLKLCCPFILRFQSRSRLAEQTRWNFIFSVMELVKDKSCFAWPFRILNSCFLLSWIALSMLFPLEIDTNNMLLRNICFYLFVISGFYTAMICIFILRVVAIRNRSIQAVVLLGSLLSTLPGLLASLLLAWIHFRYGFLGSYWYAFIPIFITDFLIISIPCTTPLLSWCLREWFDFEGSYDCRVLFGLGAMSIGVIFFPLMFQAFLVLRLLNQSQMSFVNMFIPLWIFLFCICSAAMLFFFSDLAERAYYYFARSHPRLLISDIAEEDDEDDGGVP